MDEVLVRLPGYKSDLKRLGPVPAFEKWWPTSREVSERLVHDAIEKKLSILYDRTCGAEESYFELRRAKQAGYQIHFMGFCIEPEVALKRIALREKETGRAVTPEIFEQYRARFSALWLYYLAFSDTAELHDTSGSIHKRIFSIQRGVEDPVRYLSFLEEGASFREFFREKIGRHGF